MIILKKYQQNALETLKEYLTLAKFKGNKTSYDELQHKRYGSSNFKQFQNIEGLENVPYVCLRLPTGGGKTLLSAHSIAIAGSTFIEKKYPITLWLVPTDTIRIQTLETLNNHAHINRRVLNEAFNGNVAIFNIADFNNIRPHDIEDKACIIVSTFAALRVERTEGRKVYAHNENLEQHFTKIPAHIPNMERDEDGSIKFSFINLLNFHNPLVIIDEAHNAKSELSMEVLKRVNASCIIEYTATPAKNSNVIYSVSASQLKVEEMIKLPIVLSQHTSWEKAITASIHTQKELENIALKDKDYIRPIVLFQAENKNNEITVEVLEKHLVENEGINREQIAIVTGNQKELDNINLFDPNCKIRYIITIEALKEGWDCSFAYILCSLANTKSKTSIEQLLGRVLRMPYAKLRKHEALNKAYAHVSSETWIHAVSQLHDHLVSMGFEKQEIEAFTYCQESFNVEITEKNFTTILQEEPNLSLLTYEEQSCITISKNIDTNNTILMTINSNAICDNQLISKIINAISNQKDRQELELNYINHIKHQTSNLAPADKGENLYVPQLCLKFEDDIQLADIETCMDNVNDVDNIGWNILDYYTPITKDKFEFNEQTKSYIADIYGEKIKIQSTTETLQYSFSGMTDITDENLINWLDNKLRANDITRGDLIEYISRIVRDLLARGDLNIYKLSMSKEVLKVVLEEQIKLARSNAYNKCYQQYILDTKSSTLIIDNLKFNFNFPKHYPVNNFYNGHIRFKKHFYSTVANMNKEEVECACVIDDNPHIKYWVRNLERQELHAFWLPVATGKFYPDFVAQMNDGRILILEYKGEHLKNPDTEAKKLIGNIWAKKSGNLFAIIWKKDKNGNDIAKQINNIILGN